jgi:hypothetical protein
MSPPSVSSSIVKGGVKAAFNIVSSVNISISPVGNLDFRLSFDNFSFNLNYEFDPMFLLIQRQFYLNDLRQKLIVLFHNGHASTQFMNPLSLDFEPARVTSVFICAEFATVMTSIHFIYFICCFTNVKYLKPAGLPP